MSVLSSTQFGQAEPVGPPQEPRGSEGTEHPLSLSSGTISSSQRAAAWRKPGGRPLPYSQATSGSVFKPT